MATFELLVKESEKVLASGSTDVDFLTKACTRLQENNRRLKDFIATQDAEAAYEAMHGGFLGWGCNDNKLIACLCTRTKSQLRRTAKKFHENYQRDLRESLKKETSGYYGKLIKYALSESGAHFADMVDLACNKFNTSETTLIELIVTKTYAQIQEGKKVWEARNDKSLIDFLDKELTSSYDDLQDLLFKLIKGGKDEGDQVDEAKAVEQVARLHAECSKGMFGDFKEDVAIEIIGGNNLKQNQRVAELYELTHNKSLAKALERSKKPKFTKALCALLVPPEEFIAARLEAAMKGWGTSSEVLVRLLSGLDGATMAAVCAAYEKKYTTPLVSALTKELSGDFRRAACAWVKSLQDPSGGLEATTEQEVDTLGSQPDALRAMLQALLTEHSSLLTFLAELDAETIAEACRGWGTDDSRLIKTITSRSKQHLARVSQVYWKQHDQSLEKLIGKECGGWYGYLAKFIVLSEEQADARMLDLALDGFGNDKAALTEFLFARPPRRVRAAKAAWEAKNDASLVDRLASELSGDFEKLAMTMLKGRRLAADANDEAVDAALAKKHAERLHANKGNLDVAIEIFCNCSPVHNKAIAAAYELAYDRSLAKDIGKGFGGATKNALLALLQRPADWYAARLKASFKGWGANHKPICRIIGTMDKCEALELAEAYQRKYQKPLRIKIQQECRGRYKRLAIGWVTVKDALEAPNEDIAMSVDDVSIREDIELDDEDDAQDDEMPEAEESSMSSQGSGSPSPGGLINQAAPQVATSPQEHAQFATAQAVPSPPSPAGYPSQPGGYPSQPGGYPSQPGGYPSQPSAYPGSSPSPYGAPSPYGVPSPPPQQGGMQQMSVTVPMGVSGGQNMHVQTPRGLMQVAVPQGLMPGMSFTMWVPM